MDIDNIASKITEVYLTGDLDALKDKIKELEILYPKNYVSSGISKALGRYYEDFRIINAYYPDLLNYLIIFDVSKYMITSELVHIGVIHIIHNNTPDAEKLMNIAVSKNKKLMKEIADYCVIAMSYTNAKDKLDGLIKILEIAIIKSNYEVLQSQNFQGEMTDYYLMASKSNINPTVAAGIKFRLRKL